jgi:hypothetical protein
VVIEDDTEIPLHPETAVVLFDGTTLLAWKLRPGHRLLAFEHVGRTMVLSTIVRVEQGSSILVVLDQADAAVFAVAATWTPQVLPRSLLAHIPVVDNQLMSVGSRCHGCAGQACVPCTFNLTRGCRDGVTCGLCHFEHPEMSRSAKRNRIRKTGAGRRLDHISEYFNPVAIEILEAICQRAEEQKKDSACSAEAPDTEPGSSSVGSESGSSIEPVTFQVKNTFICVDEEVLEKPSRRSQSVPRRLP